MTTFCTGDMMTVKVKPSIVQSHPVKILKASVLVEPVDPITMLMYKTCLLNIMGNMDLIISAVFLKVTGQFLKEMESVCGGIANISIGG